MTLYGDDIYTAAKMKGIVTLRDQIIWLEYSCSGIEFEFEGTEIEVEVVSKLQSVHYAWIDICRGAGNSFDSKKYIVNRKEQNIVIKGTKENVKTRIIMLKRTEKKYGDVGIKKICVNGRLSGSGYGESKIIEFIGDSITCGYGVERFSLFHRFSTKYENGLIAFPNLLCKMLNMDYKIIASSGMGVWHSHKDYTGLLALEQYKEEYNKENALHYIKNFIIINVGTNDSGNIRRREDKVLFQKAYEQLIFFVRKKNPDSYIICAIGPMKCCVGNEIANVCRQNQGNGDNKIAFIRLTRKKRDGIGKGRHPTYLSQKRIANQLYQFCINKLE